MSAFSEFFLMKPDDVKHYAAEVLHRFDPDEETTCTEIGDGNINYVFRVRSLRDGRSVIVKQADKRLRSSGRPLDIYRSRIEAQALQLESRLAPDYIPEVYHYDETMAALSMEDISAYRNLRKELLAGRIYGHLAENISTFLAQSLLPTTDLVLDRREKKRRVQFFTNPELCDITEDLVLTEPYLAQPMNPRNKNIVTPGNEDFVRARLYEDEALHGEVAALRNGFMNNAQALIHGDLHSGSIFANEQGIKVIDPEFAFYGPMGYDIGNVIGNLFFAWANKFYTGGSAETQAALKRTIRETCDKTAEKLETQIAEHSSDWTDFRADDLFYYSQGKIYAYMLILKAWGMDFKEVLLDSGQYENWTRVTRALEDGSALSPFAVRNGELNSGMAAHHLVALGYYMLRAAGLLEQISYEMKGVSFNAD